ncbi:hypothetical protein D3C73_870110 [compost metagenome]
MGLHVQIRVFGQQLAGQGQLFRGAGRCEAWGDRVVQATLAVPALDQRLAFDVAGFGGVGQVVRGVAVHHHLAGDHPQVELLGRFEERVHRLRVHAAEHQRGGGAVAQQFLDENVRDLVGVGLVGELAFAREGVGVEPVQQLLAVGADHAGLRQVDVGVDEAGGDQRILIVGDLDIRRQGRQQFAGVAQGADLAVIHNQQAVFEILVGGFDANDGWVGDAVQDGGAVGFASQRHENSQLEAWLRREAGSSLAIDPALEVCWPKFAL